MRRVEGEALQVIRDSPTDVDMNPADAARVGAWRSRPHRPATSRRPTRSCCSRWRSSTGSASHSPPGVGQHIATGSPLALIWTPSPDDPVPDLERAQAGLRRRRRHRLRADPAAGLRLRHPTAGRRRGEGALPGGQRPVHGRAGDPPHDCDLRRDGLPAAGSAGGPRPGWAGRGGRPEPGVRPVPGEDVRARAPLRQRGAQRDDRPAAPHGPLRPDGAAPMSPASMRSPSRRGSSARTGCATSPSRPTPRRSSRRRQELQRQIAGFRARARLAASRRGPVRPGHCWPAAARSASSWASTCRLRQGRTPSVSISSEKLRITRIRTRRPERRGALKTAVDGDRLDDVGGHQDAQAQEQRAGEAGTRRIVERVAGPGAEDRPDDSDGSADGDDGDADHLEAERDRFDGLRELHVCQRSQPSSPMRCSARAYPRACRGIDDVGLARRAWVPRDPSTGAAEAWDHVSRSLELGSLGQQ